MTTDTVAEEIGMSDITKPQFTIGENSIPGGDNQAIPCGILQEHEWVQPERIIEKAFGIVQTDARRNLLIKNFCRNLLGFESPLMSRLAKQAFTEKEPEIDEREIQPGRHVV